MRERPLDGVRELVVVRRESVADGVVSLTLRHPSGAPLPRWEAGAHIDLLLGVGLERQYSLCGDPADPFRWRIAVLREPEGRGGSLFVHERIAEGDTVRVRGPRNRFRLEAAPPVSLHRRRHRHHAAAAHARSGRGGRQGSRLVLDL
jgi:ferredoxin-NADP reductase